VPDYPIRRAGTVQKKDVKKEEKGRTSRREIPLNAYQTLKERKEKKSRRPTLIPPRLTVPTCQRSPKGTETKKVVNLAFREKETKRKR